MQPYENKHGASGVIAYESGDNYIVVQFFTGETYVYNYSQPGKKHVEQMKQAAVNGKGLSTYISNKVKGNYAKKL